MDVRETCRAAVAELAEVTDRLDADAVEAACRSIVAAGRIMVAGCGREGLAMCGLAMRLHHLGLRVSVQGDMAAPPLGPGDLFVVSVGPGRLPTMDALMEVAREAGAQVLSLTARPDLAADADRILHVPAQTMADDAGGRSILPMGSAYEGALFVLFEAMILRIAQITGAAPEAMRVRHTNMQ